MNTNDKATARPWELIKQVERESVDYPHPLGLKPQTRLLIGLRGFTVAEVFSSNRAENDAALIVQAVNEHAALNAVAEAAKVALGALEDIRTGRNPNAGAFARVDLEQSLAELARVRESGVKS